MSETFDERLRAYLTLRDQRPGEFATVLGGVRIVVDPGPIRAIEERIRCRYEARGLPGHWAEIGIAYQDPYLRLLRDAVIFPSGREAIHHRVLSNSEPSGAAAMPVLDGSIVLVRHFRHPTRQWHWEIPRGGVEPGRTAEETAETELAEEIGAALENLTRLGRVHGSTALISGSVVLFLARITSLGEPALDEGIVEIRRVTVAEFEHMAQTGEITDAFTLAAFLHARLGGLL